MKNSICIISFSTINRDARVLRQIKHLAPLYNLAIIGYGHPPPAWQDRPNIHWISVVETRRTLISKLTGLALLILGKLSPSLYQRWYWQKTHHLFALEKAISSGCDAFHANDWEALLIAGEAARKTGAQVVFDAHEYAPLEFESSWYWRRLHAPAITYFLRKYATFVKASITVAPLIAEKYKQEFGLDPIVALNVPDRVPLPAKEIDPKNIRLVHHGISSRDRRLETMIEALALCHQRYSLHFMLIESDADYVRFLKNLAKDLAPGRVTFHEPVAPEEIVRRVSEFEMGFYLLEPSSYNNKVALPNKFFDFIVAGLAVCIGPSPAMAEIVRQYNLGCITQTFNPRDVAKTLNDLDPDQLMTMQQAARKAAQVFNAEKEMNKVVELYDQLLAKDGC
jgi:hypothetical protein